MKHRVIANSEYQIVKKKKSFKTSALFALSYLLFPYSVGVSIAQAAPITAASCNYNDVNAVINGPTHTAIAGDTIIIPDGSCTWTSGINVPVPITLQGQDVPTRSATATDGVTITDADPNTCNGSPCPAASTLLTFTIGSSFHTTIANIRFLPGTGTGAYVQINGSGLPPLLHDCYFNLPNFQLFQAVQWMVPGGVIWNTTFESTTNLSGACGTQVGSDSGCLVVKSNLPWDNPSTMGKLDTNGDKNLYIEDSIFDNVGQCPDVDDNGRVVIRHSQYIGSSGVTHGVTSIYGGRQVEIYDSTMTVPNPNRNFNRYFWGRAGTFVITGNSIQAYSAQCYGTKDSFQFTVENAQRAGSHGCCTGYMCFHQSGSGADGSSSHSNLSSGQTPNDTSQISDPIYIWGNTGSGADAAHVGLNQGSPQDCVGINPATGQNYQTSDFFQLNRDYFVDGTGNPNSGAKPGWTRYTYPHPLRSAVPVPSTVINAASCNASDVQLALSSATAFTTAVNIPAGTCHWTNQVSFTVPSGNNNLSILGAGSLTTQGGGDATVIVDDYASTNNLLQMNTAGPSSFFRFAGITFQGGNDGGTANTKYNGVVAIAGNSQNVRVDHIHFDLRTYSVSQNASTLVFNGAVFGVTDHSLFDGGFANETRATQGNLYGDSSYNGDGSWATDTFLGSSNFMFFEDNTFNITITNDCSRGGRFVMRHNIFNASSLQTHPTGGGGADGRGCRAWEIYQNTFNASNASPLFNVYFLSSGTGVIWGNSAPAGYSNFMSIHSMRRDNSTYPEAPTPNGWGYCGTSFNGTGSAWDQNTNALTGYACIDQPGRGKGDLITGLMPNAVNSRTGTIAWTNEALEPVYEWLDTYTGAPGYPDLFVNNYESDVLAQNRDYYVFTASFNGTSGVGSGLFSARPTSCTPNVAYWATDTNTLYQCSSPNNWVKYYTPYPYPHPLISGTPGPPPPGPNPPPPGPNPPPVTVSPTPTLAVQVYPNPWRADKHTGSNITFNGLTTGTTIKLFTISGHEVKEVRTDGPSWSWDRTNDSGVLVASGIYVYLVTDGQGDKVKGKLAVIR